MYENIKKEIKEKLLKDREYTSEIKNVIDKIFKEYNIEIYIGPGFINRTDSRYNEDKDYVYYEKDNRILLSIHYDVKEKKYYKIMGIYFFEEFDEVYGEINEK